MTSLAVGDRVAATMVSARFAERVVVPGGRGAAADGVVRDGAATLLTYGTTLHALADRAHLMGGETLLVLGAAGGVGLAAVENRQAARREGHRRRVDAR